MASHDLEDPRAGQESRRTLDALDRGELVRVLAEADAGKIPPEELEEALERHGRRSWLRRLLYALFLLS